MTEYSYIIEFEELPGSDGNAIPRREFLIRNDNDEDQAINELLTQLRDYLKPHFPEYRSIRPMFRRKTKSFIPPTEIVVFGDRRTKLGAAELYSMYIKS